MDSGDIVRHRYWVCEAHLNCASSLVGGNIVVINLLTFFDLICVRSTESFRWRKELQLCTGAGCDFFQNGLEIMLLRRLCVLE